MTDLLELCRHQRPSSPLAQLPVITPKAAAALRQLAAAETKLNAMETVNNALALAANNPYTAFQTAILKHLESAHE